MTMLTQERLAAAERYLLLNARLIDRLRFAHLFRGGSVAAVRSALAAYANDDGGFGNALEPDLRGAGSQPQPVEVAFHVLDETTGPDDPFDGPIVQAACGYLARVSTADGGVPFVLPSVRGTPAAPWWQTPDDPPGNLNPTAAIVGLLHKHDVSNAFVDTATRFCWNRIDGLTETNPYLAMAILTFLDHVPDRVRAEAAFDRLSPLITNDVELDPHAAGEAHFPLDFAPHPDGFGRRLFADEVIVEHLDAMVGSQSEDGSWAFNWPAWTPVVRHEWGGFVTVSRLITLRDYGRFAA
jgi:hypothetical protein